MKNMFLILVMILGFTSINAQSTQDYRHQFLRELSGYSIEGNTVTQTVDIASRGQAAVDFAKTHVGLNDVAQNMVIMWRSNPEIWKRMFTYLKFTNLKITTVMEGKRYTSSAIKL